MASWNDLNAFLQEWDRRVLPPPSEAAEALIDPFDLAPIRDSDERSQVLVATTFVGGTLAAHGLRMSLLPTKIRLRGEMAHPGTNVTDLQHGMIAVGGRLVERFGPGLRDAPIAALFIPCDCLPF